jgi:hypothetical protein
VYSNEGCFNMNVASRGSRNVAALREAMRLQLDWRLLHGILADPIYDPRTDKVS